MPGKLEFSFNSSKLGEFQLDQEVMTIGRKEDNDIKIDNLAVSEHHAKLLTIFDDSFLEDLESTNGTFVNGKPIEKHPLKHGDMITIDKHELRYLNEASSLGMDENKTVMIQRKPEASGYAAGMQAQQPNLDIPIDMEPSSNEAKLQILNGRGAGKELPLKKPTVKLGKSGSEVVQINKRPDGHFIVCLNQSLSSPPRVNGEDIGDRAVKLHNHDVIEINRLKIEYYLAQA